MQITEIEQKLFLGNNVDEKSFQQIIGRESIGEFALVELNEYKIVDTYFDTKDFALERNSSYLRLRSKNAQHFITLRLLKYEEGIKNIIDEVTHLQNDAGIKIIFSQLAKANILNWQPDFSQPDFLKILKSAGLLEVISVQNDRIEKDIFVEDIKIGRIKFDRFFYNPYQNQIFFEIEIDTYKNIFLESIKKFRKALKKIIEYPIIETDKSKYKRGIEKVFFVNPILKDLHDKRK
ncbi:MAG: CYTH domain-containing protein [Deltaproteobacteria bacterium]|nr:CYTH domain-containing protein [Deltaproteobacteria bacterium]